MKVIVKSPGLPGELRDFPNETNDKLKALQMAVGGWIEQVRLSDRLIAIVDEEGRLKQKRCNVFGLLGTIVFCGLGEEDYTDLPQDDPLLLEVF